MDTRSHLKIRILVQVQGGIEFQPADILKYFEELKLGPNTEIGTKDFFEMASKKRTGTYPGPLSSKYVFLTAARIDIATAGINVTSTRINNTATARIDYITTGIRDFSIRTF